MATPNSPNATQRRFPLWALILGGTVVVLLLIALAVPYFLDVDRYRDDIAATISQATGRKVAIGRLRAQILPGVGLTVEGLHVGNPAGFTDGEVLSVETIRVNVAIAPLLHGTVHVNSIDLIKPKVALVTGANAENNYTFTPGASSQSAPAAAGSAMSTKSNGSSSVSLDEIGNVNLTDAEVMVGAIVRGAVVSSVDTKGVNIALHNFVLNPMRIHDWQAESKLSGVALTLEGWSAPVTFQTGQVTLEGEKMDAQFVADLATASDIKGTLSIPDVEHPQVNFEMSASQLDIDKLMAAAGGPSTSAPATPAATPKPNAAPSPVAPGTLVAQGHINVEKITTRPYIVGPANVEMRVYTDRAELFPITIGMYGGTLQISSRVDRSTIPPRFSANVQMRNLDVAKVLEVTPSARGKMGGTGELDLQLLGNLGADWKKSLSGTGKFAVRNGHLPGVNLSGIGQSLAKTAGVGSDTPFSVLEGDVTIANQRVTSKLIHLDSSVGIVDLRGSLGLDGTLDYQGTVNLNPTELLGTKGVGGAIAGLLAKNVGKISLPFSLAGTIGSPKVTPGKSMPGVGSTSRAASGSPPAASQNPGNALKSLFKKH